MSKTFSQKITFTIALLCYLIAVGCVIGAVSAGSGEEASMLRASLGATAFFFFTTGVVLHVIGTAKLKGLLRFND